MLTVNKDELKEPNHFASQGKIPWNRAPMRKRFVQHVLTLTTISKRLGEFHTIYATGSMCMSYDVIARIGCHRESMTTLWKIQVRVAVPNRNEEIDLTSTNEK